MSLTTDAEPGDIVEITYRGVVRENLGNVILTERGYYSLTAVEVAEVRVFEPPPDVS